MADVLVIEPVWESDDAAELRRQFWANVDDDPMVVVIVELLDDADRIAGVFSTYDAATTYARESGGRALVIPKRIDEPWWGNTTIN